MEEKRDGIIPSFRINDDSIPGAYWQLLTQLDRVGYPMRTQYDRIARDGSYADPSSGRDARVFIHITNPFNQPRFPPISFCELGKYIAEFLGAKDHLVVPHKELLEKIVSKGEFSATQWPYCYHQRLTAYPTSDGRTIDQLELILDKLAKDTLTRRAIATTRVPEIDLFMTEDQPCLGEVQLRAVEDEQKRIVLNMFTRWRSRDGYKAWPDNLIGISNMHARLAHRLSEKTGREVVIGPYSEENGSLHLYPQDYDQKGKSIKEVLKRFPTRESFIARSRTSEQMKDLVIDQLKQLKTEATWKFPPESVKLIEGLVDDFETGRFVP